MLTNLPPLLQLNDTVLDTVQQALRRGDEEIQLEPRVFDVLCYLLAHRERYVSLQELHEQVWAGRVVSDTAVRRTISKLRAQLQDTNLEQPLFIRSGMKRGYQWLVEPVALTESAQQASTAELPEEARSVRPVNHRFAISTETERPAAPNNNSGRTLFPVAHRRWLFGSSLVVMFLLLLWVYINQSNKNEPAFGPLTMPYEVLLDIPGLKTSLAINPDGQWISFIGALEGTKGLFLQHTETRRLLKVELTASGVYSADFVQQGDAILYSATDLDRSGLYLQNIGDLNVPAKKLDLENFLFPGAFLDLGNNQVLISAQPERTAPHTYYIYDLEQQSWQPFSFSPEASSFDAGARLSPNGKQIALLRLSRLSSVTMILVFDVQSKELVQQIPLGGDVGFLEWQDDNHLVLPNRSGEPIIYRVDLTSQAIEELTTTMPWWQLMRSRNNQWFGISFPTNRSARFFQAPVLLEQAPERLFNLPETAEELALSHTAGWYFLVEQQPDDWTLAHFDGRTGERVELFKTQERLRFIQAHPSLPLVMLGVQGRLALLNTDSGALQFVTTAQQQVAFNSSYLSQEALYYAEERSGRWQVTHYDLASGQQSAVVGYRFLAPWQQQYLAMDADGQFWLLSAELEPMQQLSLTLPVNLVPVRVQLDADQLIAVTMRADMGFDLHRLDLKTQQAISQALPQDSLFGLRYLNVLDGTLVYRDAPLDNSKVVRFKGLPF
ncbi:winged helix-turn-helix domain-containing protein [Alkalimonas sp.]|uniref:winged helix-turn-helix domain-containing protein n=1 Tax=Alkalimonas sp. TaxID=1872453 RepID=UPI002A1B5062|nr:winged helix-turn-helix domain-containing protein [Alkalimonas sp.]